MAKAATSKVAPEPKKKKKKTPASKAVRAKASVKAAKKATKPAKKARHSGLDALAKLADHPLVADLLAAGAIAAVAAIADHQRGKKKQSSSKLVKSAGQAAATAIGKKLMDEFGAIKDAATEAAKKA